VQIESVVVSDPTPETEKKWEGAFWAMGFSRYRSATARDAVHRVFKRFDDRSFAFQRALLEAVYTVYPTEFGPEMNQVLESTKNEKLFAIGANYLLRSGSVSPTKMIDLMKRTFSNFQSHPILRMLHERLNETMLDRPPWRPPVVDLLSREFAPGQPVLYSIQRLDRRFPGLAVLRDQHGRFVRTQPDSFFAMSQLALSCSNMPGYLTNGNTPQGIMSIQGIAAVENKFIGPTETIQMVLPCEVSPSKFFHSVNIKESVWTVDLVTNLLPPSWRMDPGIRESYYAGEAGRTEIIAHGTTVDPEFYKDEPCYPNTPTLGCLCATESWSLESGVRVTSDQQRLVDAMKSIGFEKGYCIVVELDSEERPVTTKDAAPLLIEAEARLLKQK
jgi:hypothetical protein